LLAEPISDVLEIAVVVCETFSLLNTQGNNKLGLDLFALVQLISKN